MNISFKNKAVEEAVRKLLEELSKDANTHPLTDVPTAAKMLGCSRPTIYKLAKEGKLKMVHVGSRARITVESIESIVSGKEEA